MISGHAASRCLAPGTPGSGAQASAGGPAATVMCGGGLGAYDVVRTLGAAGIAPAVFVSRPEDLALRSRYTRQSLLLPEFREANFAAIADRVSAFSPPGASRPVLFYIGDSELMFVSRFQERLAASYRFLLPPHGTLEAVMSKVRFLDLAREARLPAPAARAFVDASALRAVIDTIEMPCIVKPAYSQDWFWETEELRARFGQYKEALRRFDSRDALLEFCAGLPRRPAGFIVQSYVEGSDQQIVSFHGYLDETSRCLGYFLTREIRTCPPHAGDIAYCETVRDEALARMSMECLGRIGFRGIVKIDYKWDGGARAWRILEIEPHYQTWHLLGAYAGINLALIAYRHQRGEPVEAPHDYRERVRLLHVSQDLKAFLRGYRKTREWTWLSYLRSLVGEERHYRVYDSHDPGPFLYSSFRYARRTVSRLAHTAREILSQRPRKRGVFTR
jgi:D-aspartate ligase